MKESDWWCGECSDFVTATYEEECCSCFADLHEWNCQDGMHIYTYDQE